jgi:DHA2 family multidrug resistance protein
VKPSADEIQWIQTSYLIAEIIAIPLSGYLTQLLSTRIYYTLSALGFTLASVACAFSWSLGSMVAFRVLQGFLGGGMIPAAFAALYLLFPPERRMLPLVLTGMTTMLAPSLGPTIGGYIADVSSWRWLFLVNLAPGVLVAIAVWMLVDIDRPQRELLRTIDLPGLLLMAVFLGCFEYALDEGPRHDWLADDSVTICLLLAGTAGALFFIRVLRIAHPIVNLRAFRDRNFTVGSLISAVLGMALYSLVYLTPMFLGQVAGYNPMQIGQVMMVQGISMLCAAPLVGRFARHFEPRAVMAFGLALVALGCWRNSLLTADWGYEQYILPQALRGFGLVCCFIPLTNLSLGTLPLDEVKNASGLYNVMRNLGGALGLASLTTLMNDRMWLHWQQLAEATRATRTPVRESLSGLGHMLQPSLGSGGHNGAISVIAHQAQLQASAMSFGDLNLLLSIAVVLTIPMLPLIRPVDMSAEIEGAH